jgi:citrate lyase beta subunit
MAGAFDPAALLASLAPAHAALAKRWPGESGARQPVHVVYGGAHLFKAETARKLGAIASKTLDANAPDAATFARVMGLPDDPALAAAVLSRVRAKLEREPVEDYRIDFEDGYGSRPDAEEDAHAVGAARELARGMKEGTLPPFIGLRVKPLTRELGARALRTLELFVRALVAEAGALPPGFLVTLPKLQLVEQASTFAAALATLEEDLGLASRALRFEIMVEQTQAIVLPDGRATLPLVLDAAAGRLFSSHFGTYDYTASLGIAAPHQEHAHPACDSARQAMQLAFAGTGVFLSDGATNVLPVGSADAIARGWRLHADAVRRSLAHGFWQGWDLHPAQLPARYAAVFAFFLQNLASMTERLRGFVAKAAQATLHGDVFDDAATGQGLLNFFLRGLACGALTAPEVLATGLTEPELTEKSFAAIVARRRRT